MEKHITTPITQKITKDLKSGDYVYITGEMYVAKYTALLRITASITSFDLFPLPIIAFSPKSSSLGAYLSILVAVVGPAEPIGRPSLAGDGPI